MPKTENSFGRIVLEWLKYVLLAAIIVVPFRIFVAQPFIVDGLSMYPTFANNDYLVVDEISTNWRDPKRGEVVVFHTREISGKYLIKRVIGLPGETVSISNGTVTIYNDTHQDGLLLDEYYIELHSSDSGDYNLGHNEYFVLGDNRSNSADSRILGAIDKSDIVGRPILRLLPVSKLERNPGLETNDK